MCMSVPGYNAIKLITEEGRKLAELCRGPERQRMLQLCDEIDRLADQLADLQRRGLVRNFIVYIGIDKYLFFLSGRFAASTRHCRSIEGQIERIARLDEQSVDG